MSSLGTVSAAVLVDLGAVPVAASIVGVPAQNPEPPPGEGPEFGKASPVALVVILALGLVTVLLIIDMSRRVRRVQRKADAEAAAEQGSADGGGEPRA